MFFSTFIHSFSSSPLLIFPDILFPMDMVATFLLHPTCYPFVGHLFGGKWPV